jgi:hypothetical protein
MFIEQSKRFVFFSEIISLLSSIAEPTKFSRPKSPPTPFPPQGGRVRMPANSRSQQIPAAAKKRVHAALLGVHQVVEYSAHHGRTCQPLGDDQKTPFSLLTAAVRIQNRSNRKAALEPIAEYLRFVLAEVPTDTISAVLLNLNEAKVKKICERYSAEELLTKKANAIKQRGYSSLKKQLSGGLKLHHIFFITDAGDGARRAIFNPNISADELEDVKEEILDHAQDRADMKAKFDSGVGFQPPTHPFENFEDQAAATLYARFRSELNIDMVRKAFNPTRTATEANLDGDDLSN